MRKIRRFLKFYYLKFVRLQGEPKVIARGIAIGTFIGVTPTIPLHTIILLVITPLLHGSLIAAFLATLVTCNPLTYFPIYYFSWLIGKWLTASDLSWERIRSIMAIVFSDAGYMTILDTLSQLGKETLIVMLVGGFVLAVPFAIVSYYTSLHFFISLRITRRKKHVLD